MYGSGRASMTCKPGHKRRASWTGVPVLIPNGFASRLAAMQQVVSAISGTTTTGLPRSSGRSACSHEAKKELKSMNIEFKHTLFICLTKFHIHVIFKEIIY